MRYSFEVFGKSFVADVSISGGVGRQGHGLEDGLGDRVHFRGEVGVEICAVACDWLMEVTGSQTKKEPP